MTSNPDVPPFIGYVETTIQALRLIHAARQGVVPRITRRLNDSERRSMIKSGAVFVFSVEESGIKRWTDGLLWSPSRIVGNFLVYKEINERTSSRGGHKKSYHLDPPSRGMSGRRNSPDGSLAAYRAPGHLSHSTGSNDSGAFKMGGLIKKTITVTIEGSDLHLISYYTSEDVRLGRLKRPTSRPDIMALPMLAHMFRLTNFRVPPKVEIGTDGNPRLVCEGEDHECKAEETSYQVSEAVQWTSHADGGHRSPTGGTISSGSPTYSDVHEIPSPTLYSREGTAERWSVVTNNLRIVPTDRQEFADAWPPSPSPTSSDSCISRRRDLGHTLQHQSSSWPVGHPQPPRWRPDPYDGTSSSGLHHLDRSRVRSNTVLEHSNMSTRRETDHFAREGFPHRPAWTPRELTNVDKYARPQSSLPFQPHQGYHRMAHSFGSNWSSGGSHQTVDAVLQPIQTHPLPSYQGSYLSSSPEGFSAADEYADS